ncbi:LOW QUALITY PROTEIN: solute carrier family 23 member 1-like [Pomacea canaliculata]|uniref:LOW QUALITY PROTEIN: solute carrier family 23 member 1-like n=1 Tax=Pomacea canaliculata TaxID=400727 RepID=UPI000D72EF28|nr:LOW QUALITY PROTEIN: solute carrier family 23 member 1-like [Pomacea canaliculata]
MSRTQDQATAHYERKKTKNQRKRSFIGSSREDNSSEEKHQLKSFDDNEDENEEERRDIQLPSRHKTAEDDKERTAAVRLQQTGGAVFKQDEKIEIEAEKTQRLIYRITEAPPPHLTLFFALQQSLLAVSTSLTVSLLVSEFICARDNNDVKTRVTSATFLMAGLSTFTMSTFGVRLPIFQGPAVTYAVPLFALANLPEWQCPSQKDLELYYRNSSTNFTDLDGDYPVPQEWIDHKIQLLSGSLMAAGAFHFLAGITGMVGFIMRFVGPITIVPSITLIGLLVYKVALRFAQTQWGVAALTSMSAIVFAFYFSRRSTPIPAWNRRRGFHIMWYPLHQVFAILIAIIIGWCVSAILTYSDVLSTDKNNVESYCRTDTRVNLITEAKWISFPYPGQFGMPSFHIGVFVSFIIATILSILDSLGDYSACARACYVPQPPAYAFNRGIAVEGLMTVLSGATGACHATVSFGGNIGAIGLTKVASRRVFQVVGVMYIVFAVINKLGAVFLTIPHCVLGGIQIITSGIFIGVVLSNLQYVDLRSTRNTAIIGISLLVGLMLPYWVEKNPTAIKTGNSDADRLIGIMLTNPVFVGGCLACFFDNTIPGTLEQRGLAKKKEGATSEKKAAGAAESEFENGLEVYTMPWLPAYIQESSLAKYLRIFPGKEPVQSMAHGPVMTM